MSTTEIFAVEKSGDVVGKFDLRNSWGGAMAIWTSLSTRHLSLGSDGMYSMMSTGMKPLFDLLKTDKLTRWEKIVLLTTSDNAIVKAENFIEVAGAMETFYESYKGLNEGKVFHLDKQAECLRTLHAEIEEHGWRGVCWNQTSVNADSPWYGRYEELEEDGEHYEERVPYNIDRDDKHWFVIEDLDSPEEKQESA
jgi:hypothetical protein